MKIRDALDILLAELIVALREDGLTDEEMCAVAVFPGGGIPVDSDCGVTIWVRLVEGAATTQFPNAGFADNRKVCWWNLLTTVEMGVLRPAPIPDDTLSQIEMPTSEEQTAAAHKQMDDMEAMNRAIMAAKRSIDELVPVNYTPVGPDGGVVGGTWAMTVGNG
ncbi:hypothetical protein SEA_BRUHMOMENT_27 [Arthrobacter phage BruhMoment]|nr:hypothetical protein SEA_BRUHMOMENT_27 [Arthrobacter phage BruhMoment]